LRRSTAGLGYVEGRNVVIEYRDAEGKFERHAARKGIILRKDEAPSTWLRRGATCRMHWVKPRAASQLSDPRRLYARKARSKTAMLMWCGGVPMMIPDLRLAQSQDVFCGQRGGPQAAQMCAA
jgi:hypothetical protein